MKIKGVEICGFKSFPEKTTLNFESPITAVVGPNGCGKSNVVDAVKWVVGETSMKELRSNLMEDVIFAGSELRPPLNMAEVDIILTNNDGRGPEVFSDTPEISVKRRFFRDGESEFFINNAPCRLKDIADIFMGSGVGGETYSIIEQGKVEMIVSSKPEEKRLIIEEAAGITKYKSRKNAALRKMDSTRQNLLRVNDILSELKRQILSITRQAGKAEKYKSLKGELDSLQLLLHAKSFGDLTKEVKSAQKIRSPMNDEFALGLAAVSKLESELEGLKFAVMEEEKDLNLMSEQIFQKSSEIQKAQSGIELVKSESESLNRTRMSKGTEIESLIRRTSEVEREIELKDIEREDLKTSLVKVKEKIADIEKEMNKEREILLYSLNQEESSRNAIFSSVSKIAESKNNLINVEKGKREIELRVERLNREKSELEACNTNISKSVENFKQASFESRKLKKELEESYLSKFSQIQSLKNEETSLSKRLSENFLKLKEAKARLSSLVEYESQMKDFETPMKELLGNSPVEGSSGKISFIADLFEVKGGFETAVQAALGRGFRGVVADDGKTKFEVVERIRSKNLLRNVVIDKFPEVPTRKGEDIPTSEGFVGVLRDFVKPLDGYDKVSDLLFGDYVVFNNLESAIKFWENCSLEHRLVTLDGDLIEPSGMVEAGKFAGLGGGVFERRSEINEKKVLIESLEEENSSLELEIDRCKKAISLLEDELSSLKDYTYSHDLKIVGADKDITRTEAEIEENLRRIDLVNGDVRENEEKLKLLLDEEKANLACINENESLKVELEQNLLRAKENSQNLKVKVEEKQRVLLELNGELATLIERGENLGREVENLSKTIEVYRFDIALKQGEIAQTSERILSLERDMEEKELIVRNGVGELDALKQNIELRRGEFTERKNKISEYESKLRNGKAQTQDLQNRINDLNLKMSELKLKGEMIQEQVRNVYGIELDKEMETLREKIPSEEEIEDIRKKTIELKEKVDSLGEVNIGAIDELKDLEERHKFLNSQKEDLENTLVNLDKMIRKINQTSKKRFKETFDIVNEKFREVFPKLFEGGKAYLTLLDEENLLESGVDIVAQPTGKKLQNINLLSGGEKALTAIALIIAIFLYKPSPFCILDEVDAPLDDANIFRFINIIKELSDRSQFIIITHNKMTMEVAETLYGVTMEEHGVSKVVSVRFADEHEREKLEATIAA